MLLRLALFIVLGIIVARAFWRLVDGIVDGVNGGRPRGNGQVPSRGVQMVRDPVCGTFVLPDHALTLVDGRARVFFCSDACRDKYRARPSTGSGRPEHVEGRTA
jgi:YHS domain-containing protein